MYNKIPKANSLSVVLVIVLMLLAFSCKKQNKNEHLMTVMKDCTGTYLRYNEKDYHVCNYSVLSQFDDGVQITASFTKLDECNVPLEGPQVCLMYRVHEGSV